MTAHQPLCGQPKKVPSVETQVPQLRGSHLIQKGQLDKADLGIVEIKESCAFAAVKREKVKGLLARIRDEKIKNMIAKFV